MSRLIVELTRALRDDVYRKEISGELEGYGVTDLRFDAADRIEALEAQLSEARVAALKEAACWVAGLSREAEELVLSLVDAKPADAMGAGPEGGK